jgi:hypothetical protein
MNSNIFDRTPAVVQANLRIRFLSTSARICLRVARVKCFAACSSARRGVPPKWRPEIQTVESTTAYSGSFSLFLASNLVDHVVDLRHAH